MSDDDIAKNKQPAKKSWWNADVERMVKEWDEKHAPNAPVDNDSTIPDLPCDSRIGKSTGDEKACDKKKREPFPFYGYKDETPGGDE